MSVFVDGERLNHVINVHIEVARNIKSHLKCSEVADLVRTEYKNISFAVLQDPRLLQMIRDSVKDAADNVRLYIEPQDFRSRHEDLMDAPGYNLEVSLHVYVFDLSLDGEEEEFMEDDQDDTHASPSSHSWLLPSKAFDDSWDSLFFESDIKTRLMEYVDSALLFGERGVSNALVSWNKVILLHGPPGSGKTSLCKALAQKATIRLSERYSYGQLIEINSHSLFSKWFSESGKLVMKMFEQINELIQDPKALIFLLIDEVESLAKCRRSSAAGNEPGDSLRAVNALLTQIDRIKQFPNVMILTTSNVVDSIDLAFVDRADMKIFVGPPPASVVYKIYASSLNELIRVGIISSQVLLPLKVFEAAEDPNVELLFKIATKSERMSGRTLRKMAFLTHVRFMHRQVKCSLADFLQRMSLTVDKEWEEVTALQFNHSS